MAFMMSKSAYLYDEGDHNGPHLMFFTALEDGKNWGAGASGSPVVSGPYWFLSSKEPSQAKVLVNAQSRYVVHGTVSASKTNNVASVAK
jgi:hypothetical protein